MTGRGHAKFFVPGKAIAIFALLIVVAAVAVPGSRGLQGTYQGGPAILSVRPVQVLWNSDINGDGIQEMVDGKSTAVLVYVNPAAFDGVDPATTVKTKVVYAGAPYYNNSARVGDVLALKYVAVRLRPIPYMGAGQKKVTAILDWDNQVPGMDRFDNKKTVTVNIMKTKRIKILFVPVNGSASGGGYHGLSWNKYNWLFNRSSLFFRNVYPVADADVVFDRYNGYIRGSQNRTRYKNSNSTWGVQSDYDTLRKIANTYGYDRVIGIVPADYFKYHFGNNTLIVAQNREIDHCSTDEKCRGIMMSEDSVPQSIAHELGHTYGLNLNPPYGPGEEYDNAKHYPGNNGSGFFVGGMRPIEGLCFMGWSDKHAHYWVCDDTWKQLFLRLRTS